MYQKWTSMIKVRQSIKNFAPNMHVIWIFDWMLVKFTSTWPLSIGKCLISLLSCSLFPSILITFHPKTASNVVIFDIFSHLFSFVSLWTSFLSAFFFVAWQSEFCYKFLKNVMKSCLQPPLGISLFFSFLFTVLISSTCVYILVCHSIEGHYVVDWGKLKITFLYSVSF